MPISGGQQIFEYQTPALLDQANPVNGTWYEVLPETANVILYDVSVGIEDADETLEWRLTIDGVALFPNPFNATHSTIYYGGIRPNAIGQRIETWLVGAVRDSTGLPFRQGKLMKIEARKTTATGTGNLVAIADYGILSNA